MSSPYLSNEEQASADLARRYEAMAEDYRIAAKSGRCGPSAPLYAKMHENLERAKRVRAGLITVMK